MNDPRLSPAIPPQKLDELIRAMHTVRDELLTVSMLLRDHLFETDEASREPARRAAAALIQQSRKG